MTFRLPSRKIRDSYYFITVMTSTILFFSQNGNATDVMQFRCESLDEYDQRVYFVRTTYMRGKVASRRIILRRVPTGTIVMYGIVCPEPPGGGRGRIQKKLT